MSVIRARAMNKRYGQVQALADFELTVEPGRIVGLIGPNGSGKTTALKSLLGLTTLDSGQIEVLGMEPYSQRPALMQHVAYIADVGTLPRWIRVRELLAFIADTHPTFDRELATSVLADTKVTLDRRVRTLSKGMTVQLHLAIVLAIDARLLVLDEPTLGLDILYRQQFYDRVLNDYYQNDRSILITTHEVREIEHLLTDVVFIAGGRNLLTLAMDELNDEFAKVTVEPEQMQAAIALEPLTRRRALTGTECIYRRADRGALANLGDVTTPNLAELFVAVLGEEHGGDGAAAREQAHE